MIGYFFLTVFLLLHPFPVLADIETAEEAKPRIIGGTLIPIAKAPYLLQMRQGKNLICGAALLSKMFAISAAHCVVDCEVEELSLTGGATTLSEEGVRRNVSKMILPYDYSKETFNYDVAVLKFTHPMEGPNIRPVKLNTEPLEEGVTITVSGWGLTQENGTVPSHHALSVREQVVSHDICKAQYKKIKAVTSLMFCAAAKGKKGSCSGDSGGPATYENKLSGIVGWANGCAKRGFSGVYTDIVAVTPFIKVCLKH